MRSETVKLGGREYTIEQKPMGATARWRETLRNSRVLLIFQSLDNVITQFTNIAQSMGDGGWQNVDAAEAFGLARILPVVMDGLTNSIDEVWAMVFEYAPNIAHDREWLEENAYDEEGVSAFLTVLALCFPITALWDQVSGRKASVIRTNSPTRNGASGLPASGPARKKAKTS